MTFLRCPCRSICRRCPRADARDLRKNVKSLLTISKPHHNNERRSEVESSSALAWTETIALSPAR